MMILMIGCNISGIRATFAIRIEFYFVVLFCTVTTVHILNTNNTNFTRRFMMMDYDDGDDCTSSYYIDGVGMQLFVNTNNSNNIKNNDDNTDGFPTMIKYRKEEKKSPIIRNVLITTKLNKNNDRNMNNKETKNIQITRKNGKKNDDDDNNNNKIINNNVVIADHQDENDDSSSTEEESFLACILWMDDNYRFRKMG